MAKAPVDARDRTLGLYSIDDLYKKLLWDFGEFERLSQGDLSPNLPACYMAQNAAATGFRPRSTRSGSGFRFPLSLGGR